MLIFEKLFINRCAGDGYILVIEAIIAVGKKFGIKFRILPDYEIIVLFRVSFELFLEKTRKKTRRIT